MDQLDAQRLKQIKQKVKKLLNLGNDPAAFDGEVRNAMAAAQRMMDQHHLSEADLSQEGGYEEQMTQSHVYTNGSSLSTWESSLAHAVADVVGTVGWYRSHPMMRRTEQGFAVVENGQPQKAVKVMFYGPAEDVEIAKELFTDMSLTIMTMARLKYGTVFRGEGRSYCEGFTRELAEQAKLGTKARSNTCSAIVLKKADLARKWLKEVAGVKLYSAGSRSSSSNSLEAYREGRRDGAQAGMSVNRKSKLPGNMGALPA